MFSPPSHVDSSSDRSAPRTSGAGGVVPNETAKRGLRLRWPIRLKVAVSGVVVTLIISAFVGLYLPAQFRRDALQAKREQVAGTAEMVALSVSIGLRFNEPSAVAAAFSWAKRDSALTYIAVIDNRTQLFASYNPDTLALDPIREASLDGVREHDGLYITTAPIAFQDLTLGTLVLASSVVPIQKRIAERRITGLLVSVGVLLLGVLISLAVAERISRPITALQNAANRIADGDYSTRITRTTDDEIGDLSIAFAAMEEKIRAQIDALARQATELAEARDTAVEATRAKSSFLATMSHEIRTPMNGILVMLELLREEKLNPEQLDFADTAYRSAEALLTIINDVLDFSKIEAGRVTLETIDFDPVTVVEEVAGLLAERADSKNLDFACEIAPNVPRGVQGDPTRLRQILLNLTGNALKFTEHGSVIVRVTSENRVDGEANIRFEIVDSGIGLSEGDQARLFQPFMQADDSTTRRYGGTGLGLVISRQLASLMRADVYLKSAPGAGSTFGFVVTFPLSREAPHVLDTTALRGQRMLVIDEHEGSRHALDVLLSSWGVRGSMAASAAHALRLLDEVEAPDVVLLDVDMAEMDAFALATAIRAKPTLSRVRLILLARLRRRAESRRAAESLRCEVVLKPVRQLQLFDVLAHNKMVRTILTPSSVPVVAVASAGGYLLVAEDNPVNQRVARELLHRLGYEMDMVSNGREAVEAVRRRRYDAILMDCQMPEMDGFTATAVIREIGNVVPIIALTANASDGDHDRCIAAGMDDYVAKPLRRDMLLAALDRCIERKPREQEIITVTQAENGVAQSDAIDVERLRQVVGDDAEEQRGFLDLFLESSMAVLDEVAASLAARSSSELRRATHNLRGAALSVGALAVAQVAQRMEELAPNDDWDAMDLLHEALRAEFARASTFIHGMAQ